MPSLFSSASLLFDKPSTSIPALFEQNGSLFNPTSTEPPSNTFYWVGGTGNTNDAAHWSLTSGGAGNAGVPDSITNAIFDGNSGGGTVTFNAAFTCRDFDTTASTATFAGSAAISIFGSFVLGSGITRTFTSAITFASTYAGRTITLNGKTLASTLTFNGVGGGWTLQDALNIGTGQIIITNGSFSTGNQTVTAGSISSSNSNIRSIDLGTSTLNISSLITLTTTTNLTFSGASSTINYSGTSTISFGALTLGTLNITSTAGGTGTSSPTLASTGSSGLIIGTLSSNARAVYAMLSITGNITINTALVLVGANSSTQRLGVININGTTSTITCNGSITLQNVDFASIVGAGSATWSGTSIGDCGGNSGITFTAQATRYLVTAAGSNDFMTDDIWSTSSGGAIGASKPLPHDIVVIDSNSFASGSRTLVIGGYRLPALDFTNATNSPTLSFTPANNVSTRLFRDLKLISAMSVSGTTTTFVSVGSGVTTTITTAGKTITAPLIILASGTFALGDDFVSSSTITYNAGTFDDNNFNLTATTFTMGSAFPKIFHKGTGTYTLISGTSTPWNYGNTTTNLTFTDAGTIKFTANSSSGISFLGGSATYNNFWNATTGTGPVTISGNPGNNTFNNLQSDPGRTLRFVGGETQTCASLSINGTVGNLVTLARGGGSGQYNIVLSNPAPVSLDYVSVSNANFSGATVTATNSTDGGGNTGITFI